MDINKIMVNLQFEKIVGDLPEEITTLETDSRRVSDGGMYIAIKGYTVDGHKFIPDVVKKGVKVIIVEDLPLESYPGVAIVKVRNTQRVLPQLANAFYDFPSKKMNITGITGTNGKTSTAKMMNDILRMEGYQTGLTGTVGVDIKGMIRESKNTTEDALTIQKNLREMLDAGVTDVTMEVSSHGLLLGRLTGVIFNRAVFTNLTQDHLDFHGSMQEYGHAKSLLFSQLGQDLEEGKVAVLNADEEVSIQYEQMTSAHILTYGIKNSADFRAENIRYESEQTTFDLILSEKKYVVVSPFVGEFNVYNVLATITTLFSKGLTIESIIEHLKHIQPVTGRMEKIKTNEPRNVFIDYAHTPDGIEKVLNSVKAFAEGKVFFVIGTGGNRDKSKRAIMARKASEGADYVVLTTDNPRFENPDEILSDMEQGIVSNNYIKIKDREAAIFHVIERATKNDVVIIAGKGHEQYQIIGNKTLPFDDKEVALRAIKKYSFTEK